MPSRKKSTFLLFNPGLASLLTSLLAILAVGIVLGSLAGWRLPLISGYRQAFIILAILTFGMCIVGMGNQITRYGWAHWTNLLGILFGILAVLLIILMLLGQPVPLIPDFRTALVVLAIITIIKWMLTFVSRL